VVGIEAEVGFLRGSAAAQYGKPMPFRLANPREAKPRAAFSKLSLAGKAKPYRTGERQAAMLRF